MTTKILRHIAALFFSYFLAWTTTYVFTWASRGDEVDFRYYFKYLKAVLTLSGGEIIPFLFLVNIALFVLIALVSIVLVNRWNRSAAAS